MIKNCARAKRARADERVFQLSLGAWFTHNKKGKTVPAPTAMGPPTFSSGSPPLGPLLKAGHRSIDVPDFDSLLRWRRTRGAATAASTSRRRCTAPPARGACARRSRSTFALRPRRYSWRTRVRCRPSPGASWAPRTRWLRLKTSPTPATTRTASFAQAPAGPLRPSSPWARCSCCPCIDKLK